MFGNMINELKQHNATTESDITVDRFDFTDASKINISYVVDQKHGPYYTIQSAINDAKPNSQIIINKGIYKENLFIDKPNLKIESHDLNPEVFINGFSGPVVLIDIPDKGRCLIQNIKFIHLGSQRQNIRKKERIQINEVKMNLDRQAPINDLIQSYELYNKTFDAIDFDTKLDCMFYIKNGSVTIKNCLMSLSFLMRTYTSIVPMMILDKSTSTSIVNCELKGNARFQTAGIVVNKSNCIINESSIENFLNGGVLCKMNELNACKIETNLIKNCGHAGIQVIGNSKFPLIQYCTIERNNAPGIQIVGANTCKIHKNRIVGNLDGIDVVSADPTIYKNIIENNHSNGITTRSINELICQPKIFQNLISSNQLNGVYCIGFNNRTFIYENYNISFNKYAGIKIEMEADVFINKNQIHKNINQGIQICEKSSAFVEGNNIYMNIKANVALGGENTSNVSLIQNDIHDGRCEGIFIIESGNCLISRNKIYNNNDGIICCTATPDIRLNKITKNKRNGLVVLKDSRPKTWKNTIQSNGEVGLFIKDKSRGNYEKNKLDLNTIDLVIEKRFDGIKDIHKNNQITGEIRDALKFKCTIM